MSSYVPAPQAVSDFSALIDFADPHHPDGPRCRYAFTAPSQILQAHQLHEVLPVLHAVQAAALQGLWCVGYVRYEAAPAFDAALAVHANQEGPLVWFALYQEAHPWPQATAQDPKQVQVQWETASPSTWAAFEPAFNAIQQAIAQGDVYQVNFTAPLQGQRTGDAGAAPSMALFSALQRAQPGGYAAYIDTGAEQILSVSPELFFDWRDGRIVTRPMKGTARRGCTPLEDAAQAQHLQTSAKEQAENVMIVDLLRNDLSRIAQPFSVKVPHLFQTQALPSVWQMTSDVEALTRADCTLADVFTALFPCGSVTGAPKVRAMQIIQALEPQPRGVYCGALGLVRPGGAATFNVPIRTLAVQGRKVACGIGSGITASAQAATEWQEWSDKRAFAERATAEFALLETLALQDGAWQHGPDHVARMAAAAAHFAYPWSLPALEQVLQDCATNHAHGLWRVRLLLHANGQFQAQAYPLQPSPAQVRLQLAQQPMDLAHSEFVRFKTTHRAHYDVFTPTQPDVFDTLLWNRQEQVTECTRGNIALLLDGHWVTPPLHCGLLGGIARAQALQNGQLREALVTLAQLPQVQALAFLNSLRGWIPAELILSGQGHTQA